MLFPLILVHHLVRLLSFILWKVKDHLRLYGTHMIRLVSRLCQHTAQAIPVNYYKHQKLPITNDYGKTLVGRYVRLRGRNRQMPWECLWRVSYIDGGLSPLSSSHPLSPANHEMRMLKSYCTHNHVSIETTRVQAKNQSCIAMRSYTFCVVFIIYYLNI